LLTAKAGDGPAIHHRAKKSMKVNLLILTVLAGFGGRAAGQGPEFAAGRAYYAEGEFKKAAEHFQLALATNPNDAESCYWMGMSYQTLADIATPFGGKYNSKARVFLAKAVELAPGRRDYRRALFDFLLDSAGSSRMARRQAAAILRSVSESDPDYSDMRWRFEYESLVNPSADARLANLFLAAPRVAYRICELPASALSSRRAARPPTSAWR
jgi:tetratricopeptide (TPR) repeat protein